MAAQSNIGTLRKIQPCTCLSDKYPVEHEQVQKALRSVRIYTLTKCPAAHRAQVESTVISGLVSEAGLGLIKSVEELTARGKTLVNNLVGQYASA